MHHQTPGSTLAVPLVGIPCQECRETVAARLRSNPHVRGVHVDEQRNIAHVEVDGGHLRADELSELVAGACGERNPVPLPGPGVSAHEHAHTAEHGGIAHGAHDMSDPGMAAAMEADMRRRFWISLLLGLPVVLYSPLAINVFRLMLPTPFGIPHDWVMLIFSTPVALWTSSVFHIGAYSSLPLGHA